MYLGKQNRGFSWEEAEKGLELISVYFSPPPPPLSPVTQQLRNHIQQFLGNGGVPYYMKSISCIKVFREESVKVTLIVKTSPCCTLRPDTLPL